MLTIRIFISQEPEKHNTDKWRLLETFVSVEAPIVDDYICVQYEYWRVTRREWTIIDGKTFVDIYCHDTEQIVTKRLEQRYGPIGKS